MTGTLAETREVHCVSDFLPNMPVVSGETALVQRLARRLQTQRGQIPWWPDYGFDCRVALLAHMRPQQIALMASRECEKDEQVQRCDAVANVSDTGVLTLTVTAYSKDGPFRFTMTISEAADTLIELRKDS